MKKFKYIFVISVLSTSLAYSAGVWGDPTSPIGPFIGDPIITIETTGDMDALLDLMNEQLRQEGGRLLSLEEMESLLNKVNRSLVFDCKTGRWVVMVIDGKFGFPEAHVSTLTTRDMEEFLKSMDEKRPAEPMITKRLYKGNDPRHSLPIEPGNATTLIEKDPSRMQPQKPGSGPSKFGSWVPQGLRNACDCLSKTTKKLPRIRK